MEDILYYISKKIYGKIFILFCIVGYLMLITGCSKNKENGDSAVLGVSKQVYNGIDVSCMTAGDNKKIYIATTMLDDSERSIICIDADGGQEKFDISTINENKEITEITSMVLSDGYIYIAANAGIQYDDQYVILYKMDIKKKTIECIGEYLEYCNVTKLLFQENRLLMLVQNKNKKDKKPVLDNPEDIFEYNGEVLITQDKELVFDDFPIVCDITSGNEIVMYAHSDNGGYYFTNIGTSDGNIKQSELVYKDLGPLTSLTITGDGNMVYTSRLLKDSQGLKEINLSNNVSAELQPGTGTISRQGDICYSGGVTFYRTENGIECFVNSECKKDNKVIRVIESENIGFLNAPYGCGYQMEIEKLDNDEMSLRVLSQDSGYDICFMQSGDPFGYQVKEKGSFYPLTDIKGVKEYLDSCFPYLKEAAFDGNGEIWMLPIAVTADSIIYNDNMLRDEGIEISEINNTSGLISALKKLPENKEDCINIPFTILENILLPSYICKNESFNTDNFKKLADSLMSIKDDELFRWHDKAENAMVLHNQDNFLCGISRGAHFSEAIITNPYINVCKVYGTDEEETVPVRCYFVCINAATSNIDASVSYIETLCSYLVQKENTMMLTDKSTYMDTEITSGLYNLYAGGEILFAVPEELYMEEWEKYKSGKIDFEQMVMEAGRKIKMYKEE